MGNIDKDIAAAIDTTKWTVRGLQTENKKNLAIYAARESLTLGEALNAILSRFFRRLGGK